MKDKKGAWYTLLQNQNTHISLHFEHWVESENESPFQLVAKLHFTSAETEERADFSEDSATESDE